MRIVVTPSVQKPVTAAATRWNDAATVVHGQCVKVTVDAVPSAKVLDALVGAREHRHHRRHTRGLGCPNRRTG